VSNAFSIISSDFRKRNTHFAITYKLEERTNLMNKISSKSQVRF